MKRKRKAIKSIHREEDQTTDPASFPRKRKLESGVRKAWGKSDQPEFEESLDSEIQQRTNRQYSRILDIVAENDLHLPEKSLRKVVPEVLAAYRDEAVCFLNIGNLRKVGQTFQEYFIPDDPRRAIAYAIKANPRSIVLQTLKNEGVTHFDCASPGEVAHVQYQTSKKDYAKILYNNPIKLGKDITSAAAMGVSHFTAQSWAHAQVVCERALDGQGTRAEGKIEIAARLKTTNEKADINLSSEKFGASTQEVINIIQGVKSMGDAVPGISIHTGSQNRSQQSFQSAIKTMAEVADKVGGVYTVNVGGGIPVNYFEHDDYSLEEYLKYISHAVREHIDKALRGRGDHPEMIAIEIGRAMVAESADLFIPVVEVDQHTSSVYINDGVFTSFIDYPLHGWKYNLQAVKPDGGPRKGNKKPYKVFGRSCDSGDHIGLMEFPEDMKAGDYMWVSNAGAYLDSVSTVFNGFLPPRYAIYNQ